MFKKLKKQIFFYFILFLDWITYSLNYSLKKFSRIAKKESFQVNIAYLYSGVDLSFTTLYSIYSLKEYPKFLEPLFSANQLFLTSFLTHIWGSPERVFLISFLILRYLVENKKSKLSKFIKYHVLLVFTILVVENLILNIVDFLFNQNFSSVVKVFSFSANLLTFSNKLLVCWLFLTTFLLCLLLLIYCYRNALNYQLVDINGLKWLTDSVAFWVRIKTPTIPLIVFYQKRKRRKKGRKKGKNKRRKKNEMIDIV